MKTIIVLFSIVLFITSCEEVIEIDLNTMEPLLVIEGSINDIDNQCIVILTKTVDYFEPSIYPAVSDAVITVTDDKGFVTDLEETEPGIYTSLSLYGIENTLYTLEVLSEGESYTAEVTMPQKVNIDSLSFEPTPPLMEFEGGYIVNCHLHDPIEFENYYRMKTYKIDDPTKGNEDLVVFNDVFVEGNVIITPWEIEQFQPQDTVVVELLTLDHSTYVYYFTLNSIVGGMFGSSNPANPDSNLSKDALGNFSTYTVSRDTIVILPN